MLNMCPVTDSSPNGDGQSPSHLQGKGGGCSTKMLVEFVKKEKGCTDGFSSLQPGLFLYQGETSVMRIQLIPLLS